MFSEKIVANLSRSSWIRAMFEAGSQLAEKYGADNVYDFSLGNPYLEPPAEVIDSLKKHLFGGEKGLHRYMDNAGYPEVREKIALRHQKESGIELTWKNVVMTVGAAGGLNVVFKSLLNPGDEVIVFAPYFVEYNFYVDNHGGKTVVVPPNPDTLEPDLNIFEQSINEKTKAIIINTPNNPTGIIYSEQKLYAIREILKQKEAEFNTTIFVVSDQPYCEIVYDDAETPDLLKIFENSLIVNSFSKSLGLAGGRIGYIVASSRIKESALLMQALSFCNRTLGFVNAPGIFQKVAADALEAKVDIESYKIRRDVFYEGLTQLGYTCLKPQGAFYLFPKSLIPDDVAFVNSAMKYNLLLVPGSGFGCPGYFRAAYCVKLETIENSLPAFEKLAAEYQQLR